MQILLALVPVAAFIILWAVLCQAQRDPRTAFLAAAVTWSVFLVVGTELLSLLHALTLAAVLALWLAALLLALGAALRAGVKPLAFWQQLAMPRFSLFEWLVLGTCALILAGTALTAWVAPPNTYDSLSYHMPRVMHWMQDHSVAYYPTDNLRQLYTAPGAEFIILHFQLLAGSDRLANFVQWFSMLGSALAVSLIARELGVDRRGQVFAAAASLGIPMGILQATSTQTDYVTAFWLACFVYWMLVVVRKAQPWDIAAAGASLGLAALTKSTTYIFAFPFLLWFGIWLLRRYRLRSLRFWAAIAAIFLLLNSGVYVRDMQLFGNPIGMVANKPYASDLDRVSNELFSAPALASNIIRNVFLHVETPFPRTNKRLLEWITALHRKLGIAINDPRTTYGGLDFRVHTISLHEDIAGNPLQLLLILLGVPFLLLHPRRNRAWWPYIGSILLGFVVFCFYLKWQRFNSRLQLPLFVLFAPVLGKALRDLAPRHIGNALALVMVLAALPWVLENTVRPLIGTQSILKADRTALYLQVRDDSIRNSYSAAARFIADESARQCSQVGLYFGPNALEYALWMLLEHETGRTITIESVKVSNPSQRLARVQPAFSACAIVTTRAAMRGDLRVGDRLYSKAYSTPLLAVFLPK